MNTKLILVRGHPGSGKTTFANFLLTQLKEGETGFEVAADDYFIDEETGVYIFNPKELGQAHKFCQALSRIILRSYVHEYVIVHNTFTRLWEMQPYLNMAKENNHPVIVFKCEGEYQNVHGVPQKKVEEMKRRYEPYEGEHLVTFDPEEIKSILSNS